MTTVRKSVIVPHAAPAMYALVAHFERYPEFLPWCKEARVLERHAHEVKGVLVIDYRGFRSEIATRNRMQPHRAITLELLDGPFERFEGQWRFEPLGDEGSRVSLDVEYTFASGAVQALMAPVFSHITGTLVDRFVARADEEAG